MSEAYGQLLTAKKWKQIPWYVRFLLLFKKKYVAFDWGCNENWGCVLFYKCLFGVVYIVGEEMRPDSGVQ